MAEIALRDYLTEIGTLIEGNSYDEAIAHSRRILEQYSKCLEAYRLTLGKAALEKEDERAAIRPVPARAQRLIRRTSSRAWPEHCLRPAGAARPRGVEMNAASS